MLAFEVANGAHSTERFKDVALALLPHVPLFVLRSSRSSSRPPFAFTTCLLQRESLSCSSLGRFGCEEEEKENDFISRAAPR